MTKQIEKRMNQQLQTLTRLSDRNVYKGARTQHFPQGATIVERVWGSKEDLLLTYNFINVIRLDV